MRSLEKYAWVGLVSARSQLAYASEVLSRIIFLLVILYIFLRVWHVAYAETGCTSLAGLTLSQMLWYLMVAESIMLSGPRVTPVVDEEVRTGALAVQLIRPVSYPLYRLSVALGDRLVRFLLSLTAGIVIVLVLVGPIPLSAGGLLCFALSLPLAFVLDFLGYFLIGLAAFWLEDTTGLMLIYSRITMVLGGMLIPLDLFPESIRPALKALPFANIVYGPARLFVHPDSETLVRLLFTQAAAVAGFSILLWAVFMLALRRVHANGG